MTIDLVQDESVVYIKPTRTTRSYNKLYKTGELYTFNSFENSNLSTESLFYLDNDFSGELYYGGEIDGLTPFIWLCINYNAKDDIGFGRMINPCGVVRVIFMSSRVGPMVAP